MKIENTEEIFAQQLNEQLNATEALREFLVEGVNVSEFTAGNNGVLEMLTDIIPIVLPGSTLDGLVAAYHDMSPECQAEWLISTLKSVEDFQTKLEAKFDELTESEEEESSGEEPEEDSEDGAFSFSLDLDDLLGMFEGLSSQIPNLLSMIEMMELDEEQAKQIWDSLKFSPIQMVAKGVDPATVKSLLETLGLFYDPIKDDFCDLLSKPLKLSNDISDHPKMEKERLRSIERKAKDNATAYMAYRECGLSKKDAMRFIFAEKRLNMDMARKTMMDNIKTTYALKKERQKDKKEEKED